MFLVRTATIAVGLIAALWAGAAAAGPRLAVPGTPVSMEVPDGFVAAKQFAGFINPANGSNILVVEFPDAGYAEISALFADAKRANTAFAEQGILIVGAETLYAPGGPLQVLYGGQQVGAATFAKWVVLSGPSPTVMITFTVTDLEIEEAVVMAAINSIEIGDPLTEEQQLAALPYRLTASAPFVSITTQGGTDIVLTTTPEADPTGLLPRLVLGWQVGGPAGGEAASLAEPQLRHSFGTTEVVVDETLPVRFAGAVGVKLGGTYRRGDTTMRFVQYLSIVSGQAVQLLATVQDAEAANILPVVETIAQSVARQ